MLINIYFLEGQNNMNKLYLITGATGHLGTILVRELLIRGEKIRALILPNDEVLLPEKVEKVVGDVTKEESLISFFDRKGHDYITLVHCAGLISVATKDNPRLWEINVKGTENVMKKALETNVDRVIYISSVHAIPEAPKNKVVKEIKNFSIDLVNGQYAKSKAAAAQIVLEYAKKGLNVSILHPSGIIGPGDILNKNHMIRTIKAMAKGTISIGIEGGYDFVDSRDVANGILKCEKRGRSGECYILNGHYINIIDLLNTIREMKGKVSRKFILPYNIAKVFAFLYEKISVLFKIQVPFFTPYSIYTLQTNGHFSHLKAFREFNYSPRDIKESIEDSLY